jgi:hypothetical protein
VDADNITTGAGGIMCAHLLSTVQWNLVPCGEAVKIGLALVILFGGYLMYRKK